VILELHVIQNFAPSNLNRDDTNSPKSCEFGGARRARISSQCIKRSLRRAFQASGLLSQERLAIRSKRFREELVQRLVADGKPADEAGVVVQTALNSIGIQTGSDGKSQYLLFLGRGEVDAIYELLRDQWSVLLSEHREGQKKKEVATDAMKRLKAELLERLDGGRAVDLALFGRMLADLPEKNIDAASQVAHAISTHRVAAEFDYYTAVDDLRPEDTAGADMIGTVEFNSACFYRYLNVDVEQLVENLHGDRELAVAAIGALLDAVRDAVPTGKQNSFAAHNPPSFMFALVRDRGAWSLANAFLKPVEADRDTDLVAASIRALDKHWGDLTRVYGDPSTTKAVVMVGDGELGSIGADAVVPDYGAFRDRVVGALAEGLGLGV
jgi:CRISPR system Cascade subunit CasC